MSRNYRGAPQCPFYTKALKTGIVCEGGLLSFPDEAAVRDHCFAFCSNECGWRRCSIAVTLQKYYDRKEDNYGKSSEGNARKR